MIGLHPPPYELADPLAGRPVLELDVTVVELLPPPATLELDAPPPMLELTPPPPLELVPPPTLLEMGPPPP